MANERKFTSLGAKKSDLDNASNDRLQDAEALFAAGRFGSAIAMGLYALEMRLKVRICQRLDLQQLPTAFEIHDLDGLLILSGLSRLTRARIARPVKKNWNEIAKLSKGLNELRYQPSGNWTRDQANDLLDLLRGKPHGVLQWISTQP